jgi:hypothetical protein
LVDFYYSEIFFTHSETSFHTAAKLPACLKLIESVKRVLESYNPFPKFSTLSMYFCFGDFLYLTQKFASFTFNQNFLS